MKKIMCLKIKTCNNCKFLHKCNKQPDGIYDGFCELIAWGNVPDKELRATLTDPASLMVSPDFGCNMWKEKTKK